MKDFVLLSFVVVALAFGAFAQNQPIVQPNTIYAGADGKFEADPDTAVLNLSISAQEPDMKQAYAQAQLSVDQARKALKANGVDPAQMEIGGFQTMPMYDWKNPKRKVVGYQVTTQLTLKLVKDFSKLGPLTESLAGIQAIENQNVSYTLDNIEAAKAKAAEDAYKKARANAEAVAKIGGRQLGDMIYASVDTFEQGPIQPMVYSMRAKTAQAEAAPAPMEGFTPQKITITSHVNALFGLK